MTPLPSLFDLTGRVALVTGAGGHLGTSLAVALAEAGASVVATSRRREAAEEAAAALPRVGDCAHAGVALDHMDEASIQQAFDQIAERVGRVDVLVANGHEALGADWTSVTAGDFNRQLANATGYFLLARMVRDHAVARGKAASVVLLGSMYGSVASYPEVYDGIGPASPVAYQVLKGGIIQMVRHLAVYWARDGIRVNCLSPGPFPATSAPPELCHRLAKRVPMGRLGMADELKGAVVFLAADASSYMTGQNLVIDGGWTAW